MDVRGFEEAWSARARAREARLLAAPHVPAALSLLGIVRPGDRLVAFAEDVYKRQGYDYVKAESIVPSEDFMLGGGERYELSDPFDSSLSVSLRETARVWAMTGDAGAPLIWSNDCGSGRTVICNIGILSLIHIFG